MQALINSLKSKNIFLCLAASYTLLAMILGNWERVVAGPFNSHYSWLIIYNLTFHKSLLLILSILGAALYLRELFFVSYNSRQDRSLWLSSLILLGLIIIQASSFMALCLTWFFPWLHLHFLRNNSNLRNVTLFIISLCLAISSGTIAPLALIVIYYLFQQHFAKNVAALTSFLIPAFFVYLLSPELTWPSYLPTARLLPDDGLPGLVTPLFAKHAPIPFIDRESLATYFLLPSLFLLLPIAAAVRLTLKEGSIRHQQSLLFLAISLFVIFDLILTPAWSEILPLRSIVRIIPKWFDLALVELFFYLLLGASLVITFKLRNQFLLILSAIVFILSALSFNLQKQAIKIAVFQTTSNDWALSNFNPLVRDLGNKLVEAYKQKETVKLTSIKDYTSEITFSAPASDRNIARVFDNKNHTRWRTRNNGQLGNEWIKITFKKNLALSAIDFSPGIHTTDFPRGIEVENCAESAAEILFSSQNWQGPVSFTPAGFPYYDVQYKVFIPFTKKVTTNCLLIKQIGSNNFFDWSVAEIKIGIDENSQN